MINWLIIKDGVVVDVVSKETNITKEDTTKEFDTIQDDPSGQFKIEDIFTLDQWFIYNPQPVIDAPPPML